MKYAFTMIEAIFVIVILGILAAVAVPKFAATRNDAIKAKAKATISTVRSAIVSERQSRLITGDSNWTTALSNGTGNLFTGPNSTTPLLMYGVKRATGGEAGWTLSGTTYTFSVGGVDTTFTYDNSNGTFNCTAGSGDCDELVN